MRGTVLYRASSCDSIWENQPVGEKIYYHVHAEIHSCSSTKMLMEKKKKNRVLLDKASDWLQNWTVASSFDTNGNKALKKLFFSLTCWFSHIRSQFILTQICSAIPT